jgi:hypothetical protein
MKLGILASIIAAVSLFAAPACDDVDKTLDCSSICSKYDDCVGNVDQDMCVDSCKDWADQNQDNADRLDACENCVDDRSCTESAFQCIAECAFIPTSKLDEPASFGEVEGSDSDPAATNSAP